MKKKPPLVSLLLGTIGILITISLVTGCYRNAAPPLTDTPAGGAQAEQTEEGTPDLMATSRANATMAAQGEETPEAEGTETEEAPTATTAPTSTPTPTPAPTETSAAVTAAPTYTSEPTEEATPRATTSPSGRVQHTVQAGENLFRIALRYNTTVQAVADANGIANPAMIYVGQVLSIPSSTSQPPAPGGTTYVVQPGDNLFRIALKYNMSYRYLAQYNNIANPSMVYVGQVLRIP